MGKKSEDKKALGTNGLNKVLVRANFGTLNLIFGTLTLRNIEFQNIGPAPDDAVIIIFYKI